MRLLRRTLPLNSLFLAVLTPAIALSTAAFGYAAYVRLYATILEGFDRKLAALSSAMSVYLDADEALALLARKDEIKARGEDPERHPTYLKYVEPMRRLRERAGLTFLYSQILKAGENQQCVYLIDGTIGAGHSEIGATDTVPADDWDDALRVMHDGSVEQTAIRQWEQWGLLKCGWAPIYGRDGTVKAIAGADVEITVIRKKTYVALVETVGVGALVLLVAGGVSVRVARKLTHPLGEVREASLRIASGNYRTRCGVESPKEIQALARTLNTLAQMMERTIDSSRPRMRAWRQQRAARALLERLTPRAYRSGGLAIAIPAGLEATGYVVDRHLAVLWVGRTQPDELTARKVARDIECVVRRVLADDGAAAIERLPALIGDRATGWALVDARGWSARLRGSGLRAIVFGAKGPPPAPQKGSAFEIVEGETIVLTDAGVGEPMSGLESVVPSMTTDAAPGAAAPLRGVVASLRRPAHAEIERAG